MLTKADIKVIQDLLSEFATKDQLKQFPTKANFLRLETAFLRIEGELSRFNHKIDSVKEDLKNLEARLKDDIVTFKDQILKEVVNLRDDMVVIEGWREMMAEQAEEIDKIKKAINLP